MGLSPEHGAMYRISQKNVMRSATHFRELDVYQGAMSLVMRVFELTKNFPVEERYALTDQVRRSSRSVCANLAEAGEGGVMRRPLFPN
jgi:hypothetical protein